MNKKKIAAGKMDMDTLDSIIEQILTQASGDDDVFQAFGQLIKDTVNLPADGFVIGEPVVITEIEYSGNARRGLTATCRREDGSDHVIALSEVMFPGAFTGGQADLRCLDAHSHLFLIIIRKRPLHTMKSVCASVNCPWETILPVCWHGALWTTARFCGACRGMACACGGWVVLKRLNRSLPGCSG